MAGNTGPSLVKGTINSQVKAFVYQKIPVTVILCQEDVSVLSRLATYEC